MRHLKLVSYLITAAGIVAVAAGLLLDLSPTVLLIGLLLFIAGVVKITMVALWHTVAGFGTPLNADEPPSGIARSSISPRRGRT